jgi:hypothetical protein
MKGVKIIATILNKALRFTRFQRIYGANSQLLSSRTAVEGALQVFEQTLTYSTVCVNYSTK